MPRYKYYRTFYDQSGEEIKCERITFDIVMEMFNEHELNRNAKEMFEKLHKKQHFIIEFDTGYTCILECIKE